MPDRKKLAAKPLSVRLGLALCGFAALMVVAAMLDIYSVIPLIVFLAAWAVWRVFHSN
jgi:hypothetical protein